MAFVGASVVSGDFRPSSEAAAHAPRLFRGPLDIGAALAGGREVSARHILIASGSRPTLLPGVEGVEHAITSNEIFDLPEFPRRLLVVGGGYIAVEFASLFQRLGAEVTQVMRASNILRGFDEDMRNGMRDAMKRNGIVRRLGCLPTRIENQSDGSLRVTLSEAVCACAPRRPTAVREVAHTPWPPQAVDFSWSIMTGARSLEDKKAVGPPEGRGCLRASTCNI